MPPGIEDKERSVGNTIWVCFEQDGEVEPVNCDHSILCRLELELDQIARSHGVPLLSNYYDGSELASEFIDESMDVPLPEPHWYNPAEALETINVLLDYLAKHPDLFAFSDDSSRTYWRESLIQELEHCQSRLTQAVEENRQFHFAIVM